MIFVSSLLGQSFRHRPETLRSSNTEKLEVILGFDSMDSLIDHLAEKKVHDLAYAGLTKLNGVLLSEMGFELFPLEEDLKRAVLVVETRNIIVHNRAIVNDIYLKRTGADWIKKGDRDHVGLLCTVRCLRFLAAAAIDIDQRVATKYNLDTAALCEELVNSLRIVDGSCIEKVTELQSASLPVS